MASSGKRKTTMAKLNREQRLRERRMEKEARKAAREHEGPDVAAEPENLDHLDRYVDPFTGPSIVPTPR